MNFIYDRSCCLNDVKQRVLIAGTACPRPAVFRRRRWRWRCGCRDVLCVEIFVQVRASIQDTATIPGVANLSRRTASLEGLRAHPQNGGSFGFGEDVLVHFQDTGRSPEAPKRVLKSVAEMMRRVGGSASRLCGPGRTIMHRDAPISAAEKASQPLRRELSVVRVFQTSRAVF